jgi:hypothetical protein
MTPQLFPSWPLWALIIVGILYWRQRRWTKFWAQQGLPREKGSPAEITYMLADGVPGFLVVGVLMACVMGAFALVPIGLCHFTAFQATGFFVCFGTILLLRPRYRLVAISRTLATAGVLGGVINLIPVLALLIDGDRLPDVCGGYSLQAALYGSYLLASWWVNRLAKRTAKANEP